MPRPLKKKKKKGRAYLTNRHLKKGKKKKGSILPHGEKKRKKTGRSENETKRAHGRQKVRETYGKGRGGES